MEMETQTQRLCFALKKESSFCIISCTGFVIHLLSSSLHVLFWSLSSVWKCISLFTAWRLISCHSCWLVPLTSGLKRNRQAERTEATVAFFISAWALRCYNKDLGRSHCCLYTLGLDLVVMHLLWLYLFKALSVLVFPTFLLSLRLCGYCAQTYLAAPASLTISVSK